MKINLYRIMVLKDAGWQELKEICKFLMERMRELQTVMEESH